MRLTRVQISNFKAIQYLLVENLGEVVVLAGPNGCGKSSIFDAIRLWKSAHGGYQQNEVQHWLNEFQLNIGDAGLLKVMGDRTQPMSIVIDVELADNEKIWLTENAENLIRLSVWRRVAPNSVGGWRSFGGSALAEDLRVHEPIVQAQVQRDLPILLHELNKSAHRGTLILQPNANISINTDLVLTNLFSTYEPQELGVIDYHGPQRNYNREQVGGINLNIQGADEQKSSCSV